MRLIDADRLKKYFYRPYSNEESYSNADLERIIDAQPTILRLDDRGAVICRHETVGRLGYNADAVYLDEITFKPQKGENDEIN